MRPLVTVIVPTRNRAHLLPQALESIVQAGATSADVLDLDIVVIDDGSTDDTASVVGRYPARLLQTPGVGVSAARNVGIREARGEFVAFLDDDDAWLDDPISEHVSLLQANLNAALAFSQGYLADADLKPVAGPFPEGPFPNGEAFVWSMRTVLQLNTVVARRAALLAVGGFDERIKRAAEDHDLQLRLAARYDFHGIERPTTVWRQHFRDAQAFGYWRARVVEGRQMRRRAFRQPARVTVSARERILAELRQSGWAAANGVNSAHDRLARGERLESAKFLAGALDASPIHALFRIPGFWRTLGGLARATVVGRTRL